MTEQFTRAFTFAFKGSAGLNISSKTLNEEFTIHGPPVKMVGKAQLGGK